MDGAYHSSLHREVLEALNNAGVETTTVAELSLAIVEPKRFKRIEISDAEFGIPMFGTTALMWSDPKPSFLIPRNMQGIEELIVDQKMVLIPRSGQVSGIIGTAVLPYGGLIGGAVSEHAVRIQCSTENMAGFIFVALRSEYGRRQLKSRAYGSSIPTLDVAQIGQVVIPDLGSELMEQIGNMGLQSAKLRHEAIEHENEARSLVERTIESGGR
jgi:type I restriction enzyme S subunit